MAAKGFEPDRWARAVLVAATVAGATCAASAFAAEPASRVKTPFVEQQQSQYGGELAQMYGQDPEPTAGPLQRMGSSGKGFFKSIGSAFKKKEPALSPGTVKSDKNDPLSLENKPKPPDAEFYREVAQFQEQSGALDGAEGSYRKALALAPQDRDALLGLARLLNRRQRADEAVRLFTQVTVLHPQDPAGFNDLGMCLGGQRKYPEAAAALARAVQLAPQRKLYRNNIALALVELRRYEEALSHLAAAHGEAVAHYNLGYMLCEKNDLQPARFHFQKALEKQPNFPEAQQWIEMLAARTRQEQSPVPSETPWQAPERTPPPAQVAKTRQPPQLQPTPQTPADPQPPTAEPQRPLSATDAALDLLHPLHVAAVDQRSTEQMRDLPTPASSQLDLAIVDQIQPMLPAVVTTPATQRSAPSSTARPSEPAQRPVVAPQQSAPAEDAGGSPQSPAASHAPTDQRPPAPVMPPRVKRSNAAPYRAQPPSRY